MGQSGDWLYLRWSSLAPEMQDALIDGGWHPGSATPQVVTDLRDALRVLAAWADERLHPEPVDDLIERGLLAVRRDYTDEYATVLTQEGRDFVSDQLAFLSATTEGGE